MYNIYSYEKRKKEEKERKLNEAKTKRQENKHKKDLDELTTKYKRRIENFLYEMATHPVVLNDPDFKSKQKRKNLTQNFSFKSFQTDKERLANYLKEHQYENDYYNSKQKKLTTSKSQINYNIIYQPTMRFKPRNDIERIYDSIYANGGKVNNELFVKQLQKVSPKALAVQKSNENRRSIIDQEKKENINIQKEKKQNSHIVKAITKNYHFKTFFNAASQFLINNSENNEIKQFEDDLDSKTNKEHRESIIKSFIKLSSVPKKKTKCKTMRIQNEIEHLDFNDNDDDIRINNSSSVKTIFSNLPQNPFKRFKKIKTEKSDDNIMNYLRSISRSPLLGYSDIENTMVKTQRNTRRKNVDYTSLQKDFEKEISTKSKKMKLNINPIVYYENPNARLNDNDHIIIDNELYDKSDLKHLSKKILTKCKFLNEKYEQDEDVHLSGKGKTMITNGLTVNEFLSKYSLPQIKQN